MSRRPGVRWAAFPLAAVLLALALAAVGLHGSSTALYSTPNAGPGLVAGTPRPVRSDDWYVSEPLQLGQARSGLPLRRTMSVGTTAMPVTTLYAAAAHWTLLFQPVNWPVLVLPATQGVALRWWAFPLSALLGAYALLGALTRRPGVSAAVSVLLCLSPAFAWWSGMLAYPIVGYACGAAAAFLLAVRAASRWTAAALGLLAGGLGVAFGLALYPPWQVGVALVLLPLLAVEVLSERRRLLVPVLAAAAVLGVAGVAYVHEFSYEIAATTATVYPGQRHLPGGLGDLWVQLSAPLGPALAGGATTARSNPTEMSACWPFAALLAVLVVPPLSAGLSRRTRARLLAVVVPTAVLFAWALLPVPVGLGRLLLLDLVGGNRVFLGVGVAGAVAVAVVLAGEPLRRPRLAAACVAVVGAVLLVRGAYDLPPLDSAHRLLRVGYPVGFALLTAGLLLTRLRRASLALLLVWGVLAWAPVNPLQHGFGDLTRSPLADAVQALRAQDPDGSWLVADDPLMANVVLAQGVRTVSATDPYPDPDAWRRLVPDPGQADAWNRYARTVWRLGPPGSAPVLDLVALDYLFVTVDPCSSGLRELGVSFVVRVQVADQTYPCLQPVQTLTQRGRTLQVLRVTG